MTTKPLLTVTIHLQRRDGAFEPMQVIGVNQLGNLDVKISFNDLNEPIIDVADINPSTEWTDTATEAELTLKEAHQKMVEAQIAFQHAATDMFKMKRLLEG